METTPASTTSAAPASGSAAPTASAAASTTQPAMTVSTGAPGTSTPAATTSTPSGKWFDSFDADTKDYITQKGFGDAKSVVESYRNLEKLRGVPQDRLLKLPDANAGGDAPEWNEVYNKLGKPATPEGYGLQAKDPKGSPFTDWAKGTFHKLNLTTRYNLIFNNPYEDIKHLKETIDLLLQFPRPFELQGFNLVKTL